MQKLKHVARSVSLSCD